MIARRKWLQLFLSHNSFSVWRYKDRLASSYIMLLGKNSIHSIPTQRVNLWEVRAYDSACYLRKIGIAP
jgi:hypothetical protein